MLSKVKKWMESLMVALVVVAAPVAIAGLIKLNKDIAMLHDIIHHEQRDLVNTQLVLSEVSDKVDKIILAKEDFVFWRADLKRLREQYASAYDEMQRLIELVKNAGEYCVKQGDIGCGE